LFYPVVGLGEDGSRGSAHFAEDSPAGSARELSTGQGRGGTQCLEWPYWNTQ